MIEISKNVIVAFDKEDGKEYAIQKKLKKYTVMCNNSDVSKLGKGHKVFKTSIAYINSDFNSMISTLNIKGYRI